MLADNQEVFAQFAKVHNLYHLNPRAYQDQFNQAGQPIMAIIKQYEDRLCLASEKGSYSKFSAILAEKFRGLVRKQFPRIDFVGVKVTKPDEDAAVDWEIKKIKLL